MSRPVCPSAFIRLAVAIWSASSTLRGRPNLVPFARDAARFSAVRSLISSRSYSASDPNTPIIIRPAGVDESIPSEVDTSVTPMRYTVDNQHHNGQHKDYPTYGLIEQHLSHRNERTTGWRREIDQNMAD